jgi:hypothetical protein
VPIKPGTGVATRFKPGESGNPKGRPKKKPLTEQLEKQLDDPKQAAAAAKAMIGKAKKGDVNAFREVADRVEGKVAIPVEAKLDLGELWREVAESLAKAKGRR